MDAHPRMRTPQSPRITIDHTGHLRCTREVGVWMRTRGCAPPSPRGSQWTTRGTSKKTDWQAKDVYPGIHTRRTQDHNGPEGGATAA